MTDAEPTVALRPVGEADAEFLAALFASTREAELGALPFTGPQRAAFLEQQRRAQEAHHADAYPDASYDIVLVDGRPAGRLVVARREHELRVVDVSLLAEHRSRGVGTRLLRGLLDEAAARGVAVTLSVWRSSPAVRLYRRLGFAVVGDDGAYVAMGLAPGPAQANTAS